MHIATTAFKVAALPANSEGPPTPHREVSSQTFFRQVAKYSTLFFAQGV